MRRAVSSAYTAPYVVVLVDLDEGPRMMSQLVDVDPDGDAIGVGVRVSVDFSAWDDDVAMPVFRLLEEQ